MSGIYLKQQRQSIDWPASDFTWRAICAESAAAAALLHSLHLAPHARIGICLENSIFVVALVQAAARLGYCIVLFNPRLEKQVLNHAIQHNNLACCFTAHTFDFSMPENAVPIYPVQTLDADVEFDFSQHQALALNDPCVVLMSSGSSGEHKFIRLSLSAILHSSAASIKRLHMRSGDCWLATLPFYHIGGLSIIYRCCMAGADLFIYEHFEPKCINQSIDSGKITGLSVVPTMLHRLIRGRSQAWPKSLRCILLGGAAFNQADCEASQALGLAPQRSYGLSEFSSQVATQSAAESTSMHCGKLIDGMECKLDHAQILCLRGPQAFSGYESEGHLIEQQIPEQWFTTNDYAHFDQDGNLHIDGRCDEMLICGGENISLLSIQQQISALKICELCHVCPVVDPEWGQVPGLVYVGDLDETAMAALLNKALPSLQRPRHLKRLPELPLLANGKLDRQGMKNCF